MSYHSATFRTGGAAHLQARIIDDGHEVISICLLELVGLLSEKPSADLHISAVRSFEYLRLQLKAHEECERAAAATEPTFDDGHHEAAHHTLARALGTMQRWFESEPRAARTSDLAKDLLAWWEAHLTEIHTRRASSADTASDNRSTG